MARQVSERETLLLRLESAPKSALLAAVCGLNQWMDTSILHIGSPLTTVRHFPSLTRYNVTLTLYVMIQKLFCVRAVSTF